MLRALVCCYLLFAVGVAATSNAGRGVGRSRCLGAYCGDSDSDRTDTTPAAQQTYGDETHDVFDLSMSPAHGDQHKSDEEQLLKHTSGSDGGKGPSGAKPFVFGQELEGATKRIRNAHLRATQERADEERARKAKKQAEKIARAGPIGPAGLALLLPNLLSSSSTSSLNHHDAKHKVAEHQQSSEHHHKGHVDHQHHHHENHGHHDGDHHHAKKNPPRQQHHPDKSAQSPRTNGKSERSAHLRKAALQGALRGMKENHAHSKQAQTIDHSVYTRPIFFIGDSHGDMTMFAQALQSTGLVARDGTIHHAKGDPPRIFFTGDFMDRGRYDIDIIVTVGKLVKAGVAVATLGNHEENMLLQRFQDYVSNFNMEKGDNGRRHALVRSDEEVGWSRWPTAHQVTAPNGKTIVFSHAGITKEWAAKRRLYCALAAR